MPKWNFSHTIGNVLKSILTKKPICYNIVHQYAKFPISPPALYVKRQWVRERQEGVTYVIQPSIAITAIVVEREGGRWARERGIHR